MIGEKMGIDARINKAILTACETGNVEALNQNINKIIQSGNFKDYGMTIINGFLWAIYNWDSDCLETLSEISGKHPELYILMKNSSLEDNQIDSLVSAFEWAVDNSNANIIKGLLEIPNFVNYV